MVTPLKLGHIVLIVSDLERSEEFYCKILGLTVTTKHPGQMVFFTAHPGSSHELALIAADSRAKVVGRHHIVLHHFAWQMATFEDLQTLYDHLKQEGVRIQRVSDHGVALGVYFLDPDGYEIEAYYELPPSEWPDELDLFDKGFPFSLS